MMSSAPENQHSTRTDLLPVSRGWRILVIGALFLAAFAARAYRIGNPPVDFQPTRQYRSALITRSYYSRTLDSIPEWEKRVAASNGRRQPQREAPIMEYLALWGYRIAGGEYLWIPRTLTSLFWLIGGLFLYAVARRIASPDAALLATVFYLFLPFGVTATRTFLRDPLMVTLMLAGVYAIIRYADRRSLPRLLLAAVLSALSIFIKPISCPPIFGAYLALALLRTNFIKAVFNPHAILFGVISLLPTIAYTAYGTFVADFLRLPAQQSFLFHLLVKAFFWHAWLGKIGLTVGYPAFVGALFGIVLFRDSFSRALTIGLWAGYFAFGLVFNYGVHTHTYYQLMLVPTVALSLAPLADVIVGWLRQAARLPFLRIATWAILVVAVFLPLEPVLWQRADPAWKTKIALREEIGEVVGHSTKTIILDHHFGQILRYHGKMCGDWWPSRGYFGYLKLIGMPEIPTEERLDQMIEAESPEFFIIVGLENYEGQPELSALLNKRYRKLHDTGEYIIFDLTERLDPDGPEANSRDPQ